MYNIPLPRHRQSDGKTGLGFLKISKYAKENKGELIKKHTYMVRYKQTHPPHMLTKNIQHPKHERDDLDERHIVWKTTVFRMQLKLSGHTIKLK